MKPDNQVFHVVLVCMRKELDNVISHVFLRCAATIHMQPTCKCMTTHHFLKAGLTLGNVFVHCYFVILNFARLVFNQAWNWFGKVVAVSIVRGPISLCSFHVQQTHHKPMLAVAEPAKLPHRDLQMFR